MAPSTSHFSQRTRHSAWRGGVPYWRGWRVVHMPRWMQTSTTRWLQVCLSSFNNRRLWYHRPLEQCQTYKVKMLAKNTFIRGLFFQLLFGLRPRYQEASRHPGNKFKKLFSNGPFPASFSLFSSFPQIVNSK